MAAKGYMNDFGALRTQFDLYTNQNKSTAWYLYRGFREIFNDRQGTIYKQESPDMEAEESFDLLQQLIMDNSAGGGDFSIYFPNKGSANHTRGSILFRVERGVQPVGSAGLGGFMQDPRLGGYLTREDLEKERRLWELEKRNEELEAAINGPANFWQGLAQSAVENGGAQQIAAKLLGIVDNVIAGIALKNGARPQINLSGLEGSPVNPLTPPKATTEEGEIDYPDQMYEFADHIIDTIGTDANVQQVFWANLTAFAKTNPAYIYQLAGLQIPQP